MSIPWGETYSALQTKVADGLENPLAGIYFAKMHEVQKYLSRTNHMWDGFWFLANRRTFDAIPPATRDIIIQNVNETAVKQRADVAKLNNELEGELKKTLEFVNVNSVVFRKQLQESQFYTEWKGRFGDESWALLESILRQTRVIQAHADARSQRSSDPARGRQVVRAEPMSERSPL